jgi:transposase
VKKHYSVQLTEVEQEHLRTLTQKGATKARKLRRAHILLLAHQGRSDEEIQTVLSVSPSTVHRVRQRFVEEGLDAALHEKPRSGGPRKLDGKAEAFVIATVCSDPPEGRQRWTMQLLADRMVELEMTESLSDETVRRLLKKTN